MLFFLNSLGYVILLKALATPRKKQNKPQVDNHWSNAFIKFRCNCHAKFLAKNINLNEKTIFMEIKVLLNF